MKYRREVDGLRALALLPVIMFHAGFTTFSGGFVGVDIFFVISGYLITTIIVDEMEKGSFSLLNFYENRARRIIPTLIFVMLCALPFALLLMLPQDLKSFSKSLVAVPLFASNILSMRTSGYFEISSDIKPLHHTWSLAVEEQFYILFPLLLILAWKLGKKWLILLLIAVTIISLLAAQWGIKTHPTLTFYLLPTRAFELLIGALISLFINHKKIMLSFSQSNKQLLSLIGLAFVLYSIIAFDKKTPSPGLYTLIPTVGTGLILAFSNNKNLVGVLLGNKLLVWIGLISYSAYLWHQPLLAFSRIYTFDQISLSLTFIIIITTFILSIISYRYIEIPFRLRKKYNIKSILFMSLFFILFFIIIGIYGYQKGGIMPFHSFQIINLSKAQDDWEHPGTLKKKSINNLYVYDDKKPINILFFGDSHAEQFAPIAAYLSSNTGKNIGFLTGPGCPPIPNLLEDSKQHCLNLFNRLELLLNAEKNLDTIIIAGCYNCYLIDQETSPFTYYFKQGDKNLILKQGYGINEALTSFQFFINKISKTKKIIVIGNIPLSENFNPQVIAFSKFRENSLFFNTKYPTFKDISFSPTEDTILLNSKIKKLVETSAEFLNSQEIICPNKICAALDSNGEAKYKDAGHMRASYVSLEFNKIILKLIE